MGKCSDFIEAEALRAGLAAQGQRLFCRQAVVSGRAERISKAQSAGWWSKAGISYSLCQQHLGNMQSPREEISGRQPQCCRQNLKLIDRQCAIAGQLAFGSAHAQRSTGGPLRSSRSGASRVPGQSAQLARARRSDHRAQRCSCTNGQCLPHVPMLLGTDPWPDASLERRHRMPPVPGLEHGEAKGEASPHVSNLTSITPRTIIHK